MRHQEIAWLHERNNDPYGTPNKHPFWESVKWLQSGVWRIFERDGLGFAFDTRHNAWYRFPNLDDAAAFVNDRKRGVDIWA